MNDIVLQWYEDAKNVDEMQDWNPALKDLKKQLPSNFLLEQEYWTLVAVLEGKRLRYMTSDLRLSASTFQKMISRVKQLSADKRKTSSYLQN